MADSQRKSYNLFDVSQLVEAYPYYVSVNNDIINFTINSALYTTGINVNIKAPFTISCTPVQVSSASTNARIRLVYNDDSVTEIYVTDSNGVITAPISNTYQNGIKAIRFNWSNANSGFAIANLMINSGNSAKPYEPYGWVHSLRKLTTATEAVENPLYSDGTSITAYTLKGNTVQSGTPSPSNPVDVNGVGERTENLVNPSIIQEGYYGASTNYSVFTSNSNYRAFSMALSQGTYTIFITADESIRILRCSNDIDGNVDVQLTDTPYTFTLSQDTTIYVSWRNADTTDSFTNMQVMLNAGSTAKPYEPYGYKIPITSGGENLFDADTWYGAYKQADGTYQTNRNTWYTLVAKPFTNDDIGKSFCFAADVEPSSGNARFAAVINGVQINGQYTGNRCKVSFTVQTIDDKIIFDYGSGSTTITTVSNIMLNTGSIPLPYEPYNRTTTPIYLGDVQSNRQIQKLVLTGQETGWNVYAASETENRYFYMTLSNQEKLGETAICTHFEMALIYTTTTNMGFNFASGGNELRMRNDTPSYTVAQFKQWLADQYAANTPVTIYYVLNTATTGIVNEPLMKIGDYTDTLSNATAIPTTEGANSITVDTTVQPSDFSATWSGWHNASVKEKSENLIDVEPFTIEANAGSQNILLWSGTLPVGNYTISLNQDNALTSSTRNCIRLNIGGTTYYENSSENYHNSSGIHTMAVPISDATQTVEIRYWAHTLSNDCTYSNIMLNSGTTAQTYEPYWK